MPSTSGRKSDPRSPSIVAVAVVQFIGSVVFLIPAGIFLLEDFQLYRLYPQTYRPLHPAVYVFYMVLPIGFALMGIVTSIGLWFLREWARKSTLFLTIVPAMTYTGLVILRPSSVFPGGRTGAGALFTVGGDIYFDVVAGLVCLLVPVSIWWLLFLNDSAVKARFQSGEITKP